MPGGACSNWLGGIRDIGESESDSLLLSGNCGGSAQVGRVFSRRGRVVTHARAARALDAFRDG